MHGENALDFALSPSQQAWQDAAVAFAKSELKDDLLGRDDRRQFWRDGWLRCARFGLQGLPIPVEFGGKGEGLPETIAAMEGIGFGGEDNGLIFAINATLWTVSLPILAFGTEEQKRRWAPRPLRRLDHRGQRGERVGSGVGRLRDEGDGKAIGGRLDARRSQDLGHFGARGGRVRRLCDDRSGQGRDGNGAFILPKETPGFRVVREIPKMGLRTVPMGEIAFESCRIPLDSLLGREGRGAEVFQASMEWERGSILAASLGTMRRQLERCIAHARKRRQFGKPIGKFQAVANRIVEMALRLETCRPLVYKIGWLKSRGEDATMAAAMAKLHVSDCFVKNSLDAVQIFGASGYASETEVERDLRDGIGSLIYSGTSDIQRNIIARALKL